MNSSSNINLVYDFLLKLYGPQGWWPLDGQYSCSALKHPLNKRHRFEVSVGAILTQNTNWHNVELSLDSLRLHKCLDPHSILSLKKVSLEKLIRPSGFFREKAKKLKEIAKFTLDIGDAIPGREELLSIWGVGPETADSILLYGYDQLEFVIDAYTKRIFESINFIQKKMSYDEVKSFFELNLPKKTIVYQEFHALIVVHAKNFYKKNSGPECPIHLIL